MNSPNSAYFQNLITQETIEIDTTMVSVSSFATFLSLFSLQKLTITNAATEVLQDDGKNFSVTGQTRLWETEISQVDLYFDIIDDNNYEFQFTGICTALSINKLLEKGVLPSHELNQIQALLNSEFSDVKIVFDSEEQRLYFGALESDLDLPFPDKGTALLTFQQIGFEFSRRYASGTANLLLQTDIEIGTTPFGVLVELPLGGLISDNVWIIREVEPLDLSQGLQDLFTFFAGTQFSQSLGISDWSAFFPKSVCNLPSILLSDLELHLDPKNNQLCFATFTLESGHLVTLGESNGIKFTLDRVGVNFRFILWNEKPSVYITLFGLVDLSETIFFSVNLSLPTNTRDPWVISMAGLVDFSNLNHINNLAGGIEVNDFSLPSKFFEIRDLRIQRFDIIYEPTINSVTDITLNIESALEVGIPPIFSLQNPKLYLHVTYDQQTRSRSIDNSQIKGIVQIGNLLLSLEATKDKKSWQFRGNTLGAYQIGDVIDLLLQKFNIQSPDSLKQFVLKDVTLQFTTTTEDPTNEASAFDLICDCTLPFSEKKVEASINIHVSHQGNQQYEKKLTGNLTIGSLQFTLIFDTNQTSTNFLAAYHDDQTIKIKDLIGYIDSQLKDDIPEGLEIRLKDALFAYSKQPTSTNFIFGLNIGGGINLSQLPLVGTEFPKDQTIGVDDLQLLIASTDFTREEITTLNNLIPPNGAKLSEQPATTDSKTNVALPKGLNVTAKMQFGSTTTPLALPVASTTQLTSSNSSVLPPSTTNTSTTDNATWFKIQKSFGPVSFERVGVQYKDAAIWFLLDASLTAAGLSLSLDGLSVNSPLNKFEPKFDLKGLGIDYKGGETLEIGGAFLRTQVTKDGKTDDEYDGAAVIKFKAKGKDLTLSAIGSYTYVNGHPSLFIYALLDYPIGGPSFFFVTGLAAGFGYNRALKAPTIDQVATFPLVAEAIKPPAADGSNLDKAAQLTGELTKLRDYIPPETGQIFLAIGVKFNSFKIIDAFVLLTIAFGNRFELNILGLATLIAPPNVGADVPPVAEVQLALKASFLPAEGFLGIIAQLTPNSYILSKACHLTGGFAFYTWFAPNKHDGDFVLTLGGYHPLFKVPDHYPKVPRLGLNWQVSPELYLKADAYFALTPSAIMAGGHLQATWNSGPLSAWFNAGLDFLMSWKPYHYDISIYVDMGVSYTFQFFGTQHITVELGANLHIWGPEFTGIAQIHLWIISFDVRFGSSASQAPTAINWNEFKNSFLPANDAICSIAVKDGLVRKVNQDDKTDLGVINPKNFCLVTNSIIPIKTCNVQFNIQGINTQFGIGSMAVTSEQLTSDLTITMTRDGNPINVGNDFICKPLTKKVPVGLWGESLTPDLNGNQFIENTISGVEIKPKKQPDSGATKAIDRSNLQFSTDSINNAYHWEIISTFQEEKTKDIRGTIVDNSVKNTRETLLKALNLNSDEIALSSTVADNFLASPKIGVLV